MAAAVAALDLEGGLWDVQLFGQELETHLVGGPIHRRGGKSYFKGLIVEPGNCVFRSSGLDVGLDGISIGVFFEKSVHVDKELPNSKKGSRVEKT